MSNRFGLIGLNRPTPKAPGTNAIPQTSNDVVDQQHHYEAHNHLSFSMDLWGQEIVMDAFLKIWTG